MCSTRGKLEEKDANKKKMEETLKAVGKKGLEN